MNKNTNVQHRVKKNHNTSVEHAPKKLNTVKKVEVEIKTKKTMKSPLTVLMCIAISFILLLGIVAVKFTSDDPFWVQSLLVGLLASIYLAKKSAGFE